MFVRFHEETVPFIEPATPDETSAQPLSAKLVTCKVLQSENGNQILLVSIFDVLPDHISFGWRCVNASLTILSHLFSLFCCIHQLFISYII